MGDDLRKYTKRNLSNYNFNLSVNAQILIINVVFFLAVLIFLSISEYNFDSLEFWNYIAINPGNILAGRYLWTIITSMFMHVNFFHLFVNMLSLIFVGSFVERLIGKKRYLFFYIFSGIFAGLFFVLIALFTNSGLNTYAVGASGALFALVGFLMLITPNLPVYMMFIPIPVKMKYAGVFMLTILWLISNLANVPIGNTAHLGGLIAGLIYGFYIKKKYKRKSTLINKFFS